ATEIPVERNVSALGSRSNPVVSGSSTAPSSKPRGGGGASEPAPSSAAGAPPAVALDAPALPLATADSPTVAETPPAGTPAADVAGPPVLLSGTAALAPGSSNPRVPTTSTWRVSSWHAA